MLSWATAVTRQDTIRSMVMRAVEREKMSDRCLLALVVFLTLPAFGTNVRGQSTAAAAEPIIIERILVKVNGEIVTQSDLESRQIAEIRRRGAVPGSNAELARLVNDVTPEVITAAVDELLMVQKGRELGYSMSDAQFESLVENLTEENGFEEVAELEAALRESEGLTIRDLRRLMERQMLVSQVQQVEIINRVSITDVEAREYYDSHLEEFTTPPTATLREILIGVPEGTTGVNAASDEQARTVAKTTVARLRAGEDFATLAAEVSESPSKANGGLIGPLRVDEYSDVIRQFIETLDVGDVADPLRTPQGYQIVMLEDRRSAVADPFEDVRDNIASSVFNDRRTREYAEYLETLRDEATIEWKNDDLRRAYDDYRAANPTARPIGP